MAGDLRPCPGWRARPRHIRLPWIVALEDLLAVRVDDAGIFRQRHVRRAVLEAAADHRHRVARLDDVLRPAPAAQLRGGAGFSTPPDGFAAVFRHVENEHGVRVDQLNLDDGSFHRRQLVLVTSRITVVREQRRGQQRDADGCDRRLDSSLHGVILVTSEMAWLFVVVPGVIWGASFLFIAEGLQALAPMGVTFVRIAVGFVTLSLVPSARRPIVRGDRLKTALLGILWLAFPLSMCPFAEQHVSSALAGMLNGATPLFAALVASMLARRAPSRRVAAGLAIGFAGAALIALSSL